MTAHEMAALLQKFEEVEGRNSASKRSEQKKIRGSRRPRNRTIQGKREAVDAKPNGRSKSCSSGCFRCGWTGHLKVNCPHNPSQSTLKAPSANAGTLSAGVAVGEGGRGRCGLTGVALKCRVRQIGAILDVGAEISREGKCRATRADETSWNHKPAFRRRRKSASEARVTATDHAQRHRGFR